MRLKKPVVMGMSIVGVILGLQIIRADINTTKLLKVPKTSSVSFVAPLMVKVQIPFASPTIETVAASGVAIVLTPHQQLMQDAGIAQNDWYYADYIVSHESSWRYWATEPTTSAYGLCQSYPAYKMSAAGSDWRTNPVTQLDWCNMYAQERYGGWSNAYSYWVNHHDW